MQLKGKSCFTDESVTSSDTALQHLLTLLKYHKKNGDPVLYIKSNKCYICVYSLKSFQYFVERKNIKFEEEIAIIKDKYESKNY